MGANGETILIVDDDDDIRELLFDRLEFMGHQVLTARNGVEGLERIEADHPDLVMLDIQMPELDGFGVLEGIREKGLDTTVVMITANGTIQRAVQAMQKGAFDFLLKPFQPRDIEQRVNRALAQVRLERENLRLQAELEETQQRLIDDLRGELQVAHDMQMALLHEAPPDLPGVDLAGTCIPARQAGGDYYTYISNMGPEGDRWGIVLADVSGRGMQAATVAMRFNEMLRYESVGHPEPEAVLSGLDRSLRGHIPPEMFVTCGIAEIDAEARVLRFATAACPEVYHYTQASGEVTPFGVAGFPLGLPFELPEASYQTVDVPLGVGDFIVFTSDGVEEAQNAEGEFYGDVRLCALILEGARTRMSAETLRDRVVDDVMAFVGEAPQTDDVTVVVMHMG